MSERSARATATRRRLGAPRKEDPAARELVLTTASDLFYAQGMRAIGVDTIVERSGVSKTTLYRHFKSKDELVAAVLDSWNGLFWTWWDSLESKHPNDPRAQLRDAMTGLADQIAEATFRGCPFLNFATEFPAEGLPGWSIAKGNKQRLRERLLALLRRMKTPDAEMVADQLLLLANGAYATGILLKGRVFRDQLVAAAMKLAT
jgi:AcrR family transcriptional regulator